MQGRDKDFHGIIPAHAGSTVGGGQWCGHLQDHPRSRGEHCVVPFARYAQLGSSPLTRGAHFLTRGNSNDATRFHSL